MSRSRVGITVLVLAAALASITPADARLRIGGPLGVLRAVIGHALPGARLRGRHYPHASQASLRDAARARRNAAAAAAAGAAAGAGAATVARSEATGAAPAESTNTRTPDNAAKRAQLVASAALTNWRGGRESDGWWRHGDGGYGWVGPLFWPFAYSDIYDYTFAGDRNGFWDYGYPDIYAALFAPYAAEDLAAYLAPARRRGAAPLSDMCGSDKSATAGLPFDRIEAAIKPTEAQRASYDELAKGAGKAAETVRKACAMQIAMSTQGRLAAMEQRIQAMIEAVELVRPALEKLYGVLDDAQKARLNALADNARKTSKPASAASRCGAVRSAAPEWPAAEIESTLHPLDSQRTVLKALQDAGTRAADMLQAACQANETGDNATPVARLIAVERQLDSMLLAVEVVRSALADVYDILSDDQKIQFETIGPKRTTT